MIRLAAYETERGTAHVPAQLAVRPADCALSPAQASLVTDPPIGRSLSSDRMAAADAPTADIVRMNVGFDSCDVGSLIRRTIERMASVTRSIAGSTPDVAYVLEIPDTAAAAPPRALSLLSIADRALSIADVAATAGVTIAIANGRAIRTATMMWQLLERVNHPAVGCCWDLDAALQWGETPAVSVPTLGTRIISARLGSIGEPAHRFVTRLRGIGFAGWITLGDRILLDPVSLGNIQQWITPSAPGKSAAKTSANAAAKAHANTAEKTAGRIAPKAAAKTPANIPARNPSAV